MVKATSSTATSSQGENRKDKTNFNVKNTPSS